MSDNVFGGLGVRIELSSPDDFLKIKETLERIGVASRYNGKNVLNQSCHILHKRGEYAILHFLELFQLDGRHSTIGEDDIARRNLIVSLITQWGLCRVIDGNSIETKAPISQIKIVPYAERKLGRWLFRSKYSVGGKKHS